MLQIVNVVIPVFAIIALGYLAVRFRLFPADGTRALVAFVNNFATPCLLFQAMVTSDFSSTFNLAIILPFYAGALVCLAVGAIVANKVFGNRPGESVAAGFAATFSNTVLLGIPIIQRAYGDGALPTVFSIIAFHAAGLITIGMLVMELTRRDNQPLGKTLIVALQRIIQNPLLWGVALGGLVNHFQVPIAEPATAFLTMMAAAVLPAALFGLGGALNAYRLSESWVEAGAMSLLKLVLHPIIAYVLMVPILHVPIEYARYGILLSAMPAGINVYVFATYYDRAVNVATNAVLISTVGSVLTVTAWLYLLG